ncbi:DMT family transporter [Photobacterium atrarenae]|uniref:DMT family transporter n=1 Tax=Photobacterium atrarenae TaxID=865757 RepID=A0ABY5GMG9_9GAMM|nr:DMT family transporter [Photobacterium atrarenae]UTV30346.1 DMT family transporter [Photobacterium atrarenae]
MTLDRRADLILIATTMLAAAGWIFSKEAIQGLPPFGFIGARFVLASLCLLPFCYSALKQVKRRELIRAMGVGCLLGCSLLLWIFSISVSETLGEGAFIMSLSMLFVPLIAWPLFRQRPPRMFWWSLPLAVGGLMLLALGGAGWQQSASQLWFLCAALTLALHFNVNSRVVRHVPPLLLTCIQLFVTGMIGWVASLSFETWPETILLSTWGWFAMSVLLATSLRYVMQTTGQKHSTAANAAIIMVLEPVWTVVLSILWYGETMPIHKFLGCCLILSALLFYRSGPVILSWLKAKTR